MIARVALVLAIASCLSEPPPPTGCQPSRPLSELNTPEEETDPWLSPDRLEVLFASTRDGNIGIYRATRASVTADFSPPVRITTDLSSDSTSHLAFDPVVSHDNSTLWYVRDDTNNGGPVFAAMRDSSGGFTPVGPVFPELGPVLHPRFSTDELTVVFAAPSSGGTDIFVAVRPSLDAKFQAPSKLSISSGENDGAPSLSSDGQTLYFDTQDFLNPLWRMASATRMGNDFVNKSELNEIVTADAHDEEEPSISPDGFTLLFASDVPDPTNPTSPDDQHLDLWIACE